MCNCYIGVLNNYNQSDLNDLYLSDYKEKINNNFKYSKSYEYKKTIVINDVLDRRKGFARLFRFCPNCGKEINLKILKENNDEY